MKFDTHVCINKLHLCAKFLLSISSCELMKNFQIKIICGYRVLERIFNRLEISQQCLRSYWLTGSISLLPVFLDLVNRRLNFGTLLACQKLPESVDKGKAAKKSKIYRIYKVPTAFTKLAKLTHYAVLAFWVESHCRRIKVYKTLWAHDIFTSMSLISLATKSQQPITNCDKQNNALPGGALEYCFISKFPIHSSNYQETKYSLNYHPKYMSPNIIIIFFYLFYFFEQTNQKLHFFLHDYNSPP